jgi:hypothetical protein
VEITSSGDGLRAQRELIERLEREDFSWDILVGDAFVRGMRDIGYKSTPFAVAELVDNAMQASASRVDVVFGFDGGSKPSSIAVVDDGYGMEPKMVRASLIWGAGTRTNTKGMGKYGYGLPSASVSQCHRVTVFSKTDGSGWYSAYLDIDEIADGKWTKQGRIEIPEQERHQPPAFVLDFLKGTGRWPGFEHGTVVLWEKLDRTDYKLRNELRNALVTDLGVIYRNYLVGCPMTIDGESVQPCDPLFLTDGFRYYDLDEDRAIAQDPAVVEVTDKSTGKTIGNVYVRYARMPATFFRKPHAKYTNRPNPKTDMNERLAIADANNGIIFLREGRQIDVIRPPRSLGAINATTDRFWAVEVNFDCALDEMFSITTSKQQVRPDDRIWDILRDKANLFTAIGVMRTAYEKEARLIAEKVEADKQEQRASIEAIEGAEKFRFRKPPKETPERQAEAEANLKQAAKQRAEKAGLDPAAVEHELQAERQGKTHAVETEDLPGAPFFRCVQEGGTKVLYLNVAHPFYGELYAGQGSSPRLRAGLEILLWSVGEAEVEADPESDRRLFYERERASVWSPYVADALSMLNKIAVVDTDVEGDDTAA